METIQLQTIIPRRIETIKMQTIIPIKVETIIATKIKTTVSSIDTTQGTHTASTEISNSTTQYTIRFNNYTYYN